jgi:hypothetical protein
MYKKKQAPIRKAIRKKAKDKRAKQGHYHCLCNHVVFLEGVYQKKQAQTRKARTRTRGVQTKKA